MPKNRSTSAPKRTQTTISDVAAAAGVSIKTVSRVLNREPGVRSETRARVEGAMENLRYRPNSPGRMLAGRRSYILGLVYNANSSYTTSIQNGALAACSREHYDLLIHPCRYHSATLTDEIADLVTTGKVDGLILTPPISDLRNVRRLVRELGIPTATIARGAVSGDEIAVRTNDREVSAAMTRYLADLGHRKIAFVRSHPDHHAMAERFKGFLDGMRAAGLPEPKQLVMQGENTFESGLECGRRLLHRKRRPTAIFCANDHMAAGVLHIALSEGVQVPADLSVAGFDDIPLASQIWPSLTTIRQPLGEMAELAASLLIDRLRGAAAAPASNRVEASLRYRESTGPAPGKPGA